MFKQEQGKDCKACRCGKLCVVGIGLAAGLVNGLSVLVLALITNNMAGFGAPVIHLIGSIYRGYAPGLTGALWGFLWGFLDAFVVGVIFALIYNGILYCCKCCCAKICKADEI